MKITEKQFLNTVRETALRAGWLFFHPYDSRRSDIGFPDIVMTKKGYVWFIELKTEKGQASSEQDEWLYELSKVPGPNVRCWLLRPSGFDKFWQEMRKI